MSLKQCSTRGVHAASPTLLTKTRFKLDRTRKENIVLKVDVPVQVVLKLPETIEECVIGRAGIFGGNEIPAQTTDLGE